MMSRRYTMLLVATLAIMLAAPAFGNSQGTPEMHNDRIIPEDWLKEKGKNKHSKFIKIKYQSIVIIITMMAVMLLKIKKPKKRFLC